MPTPILVEHARIRKAMRDCPMPILSPLACIRKARETWGPYHTWVSWSGGRCSTVVLHKALQVDPNIRVLFNDTGVEFPETYEFIDKVRELWNVNLRILKPKTTFWKIVNKSEYAQPEQGYCNLCAETRLITHCAWVLTRSHVMQKLNLCSECEKAVTINSK